MGSKSASISIIIPSLDPFGSQRLDMQMTLKSIQCCLNNQKHEVLAVSPPGICRTSEATLISPARLISETAPGHSNALNTGVRAAQGDHLLVLNPGDQMLSSPQLTQELKRLEAETIHCFRVVSERGLNGGAFPIGNNMPIKTYAKHYGLKTFAYLPHQGLLLPRSIFMNNDIQYDSRYRLRMDFNLLMKTALLLPNRHLSTHPIPLSYYAPGGISQAPTSRKRFYAEEMRCTWELRRNLWPSSLAKALFYLGTTEKVKPTAAQLVSAIEIR